MGGLKTVADWSADDDRLLIKAVEDGASLESLAKGAVLFSHRFTIEELQQRWHSLLYNVDISSEASARIINFEIELSVSSPLKASRACNIKEKDPFERQGDDLRKHYYAMRKRDFRACYSTNLDITLPPSSCVDTNDNCGYEDMFLAQEGHDYNNFAGVVHMPNHYAHPESCYESEQQAFLEAVRVDSAAASGNICYNVYDTGYVGSVDEAFLKGMEDNNEIYGYTENISSASIDKTRGNDIGQSFDYDYVQGDFFNTCIEVQETKTPQILPINNPSESDDPGGKPISVFDPTNGNQERFSPAFLENHNLTSLNPNSSGSFQQLGYSSLPPATSFWTTEDICGPAFQMDGYLEDKDQGLLTIDDFMTMDSDDETLEPKLNNGISGLNNQTDILESDFRNSPTSFINFDNDVELDIKEDIDDDTSLADHINALLSSDSDAPDDVPNSSDPRAAEGLNSCSALADSAGSNESYNPCKEMNLSHDNNSTACVSRISMPSTVESCDTFLICTLNTEDQEIPCNDGVILLPPSNALPPFTSFDLKKQTSREITSCDAVKAENRELTAVIDQQLVSSLEAGSSVLPKTGVTYSSDGHRMKTEPFQSPTIAVAVQYVSGTRLQEEEELSGLGKHINPDTSTSLLLENQAKLTDTSIPYPASRLNDCMQYAAMQTAEMVSPDLASPDAAGNVPTSDKEEQPSNSESAVPNFYDIESMILNMDLGTYDSKSSILSKEASRNHSVDTKKTIMRLEQGARSYINRVILSHGAFAVFYGYHLKYFIKEREVTVGRATEEYMVDIDLGREGRANKISRIQAIIRLKDDGIFVLKNYGKCSIFVSGKEVQPKTSTKLNQGSLIEIKEMRFMFQANESAVKHYIAHTSMKQPKKEQMI